MTTRRVALVALGAGIAAIPFAARTQPARGTPRLGVLQLFRARVGGDRGRCAQCGDHGHHGVEPA
ncbi:MAG: hypothetical protein ABI831_09850 [Betaproteobacteria bacterium]